MKYFLRSLFLLVLVGFSSLSYAQTGSCSVTDLVVQNVRVIDAANCIYEIDVAFTISSQSSKFIYFQTYAEAPNIANNPSPYPDYWDCQDGTTSRNGAQQAPEGADVGNPILNVLIDNRGADPVFATSYLPDPAVALKGPVAGVSRIEIFDLPNDLLRFNLFDLRITIPTALCGQPFVAVTDFFGTNANNPEVIQCVSCGIRSAVGFYTITFAQANCATLQYTAVLSNNTAAVVNLDYEVFADVNGDQLFAPGVDVLISPPATPTVIGAGAGTTTTLSGPIPTLYRGFDLFLASTLTSGFADGSTSISIIPATECTPLPVRFKSFLANRKNQNIELLWETATEDNNRGFYVQRFSVDGWKDIGFVASKADAGNSSAILSYNYTDLNNTSRGVSLYRIMQMDIDGKAKLSDVRQVRGLNQIGKLIVYPNPSFDGKANVLFDDGKSAWNVSVTDMNGRIIKQFKGVINNVLIDNLLPGMYMIRMVDTQTGEQTAEKLIVNNR